MFGVLSYIVAQRSSEIGIRIALGAQRAQVLGLMLSDGMRLALIGLFLGLGASAATTRLIKAMLYGTRPLDLPVFTSVAALLLTVATLACMVPAWLPRGSTQCKRFERNKAMSLFVERHREKRTCHPRSTSFGFVTKTRFRAASGSFSRS
jgi:predicted lysophospholipase L1 biosynthesis ABC-type transport system permease subunit